MRCFEVILSIVMSLDNEQLNRLAYIVDKTVAVLRETWNEVANPRLPKKLYHYTSFDVMLRMIQKGKLSDDSFYFQHWLASTLPSVEDEFEGVHGAIAFHEILKSQNTFLNRVKPEESQQAFGLLLEAYYNTSIISFTDLEDHPLFWEKYGHSGHGVCLEIDVDALLESKINGDQPDSVLLKVEYDWNVISRVIRKAIPDLERIAPGSLVNNLVNSEDAYLWPAINLGCIFYLMPMIKSKKFSSEREFRLVTRHFSDEKAAILNERKSEDGPSILAVKKVVEYETKRSLVSKVILGSQIYSHRNAAQLEFLLNAQPEDSEVEIVKSKH